MAIDSPHRCRCVFCCCFRCSHHTLVNGCNFWVHSCVFHVFFGVLVCVWNVFSPLSNILNYRKEFLYSSTNCDSKIASPTLVENPHSLHGSLKNYYPKIVASFKDQREYCGDYSLPPSLSHCLTQKLIQTNLCRGVVV